jgi:hypothetical protein
MSETNDMGIESRRLWIRFVVRAATVLVIVAVGFGAWMVYCGITVSLQAEENLHATLFTIRLVEQFVAEQGRWPRSWGELEAMPVSVDAPATLQRGWPASSPEIQRRVAIDFAADTALMVRQDPTGFTAIKPIGLCFEYHHYDCVPLLQATIRRSIKPR